MRLEEVKVELQWLTPLRHALLFHTKRDGRWALCFRCGVRREYGWVNPYFFLTVLGLTFGAAVLLTRRLLP